MKIKFDSLILQARQSREVIPLNHQISFFYGRISAGKSSIARLIDYCLGGGLERTYAITQELVSVTLSASFGNFEVLIDRDAQQSSQVRVTWRNLEGEATTALVPIQAGATPVWGEHVYNLSDLFFHFSGITPIKVRKNRADPDAQLIRLSFRDLLWYCYIQQDHLDSSFFRLEDPIRRTKSRDVMRFVFGYYTERLNDLESELSETVDERNGKIEAAKQIRKFLQEFGYSSEGELRAEIDQTLSQLESARAAEISLRNVHTSQTHFADELRKRLRTLSQALGREEQTAADLSEKIREQDALRAELLSTKFKLTKANSASAVLSGVKFEFCPMCGTHVGTVVREEGHCQLCGINPISAQEQVNSHAEAIQRDLDSRIDDLNESISRHQAAFKAQEHLIERVANEKRTLDERLVAEMRDYDSAFLSRAREYERVIATLEERVKGLKRIALMPESVARLEREADGLLSKIEGLRRAILEEKAGLVDADLCVNELEDCYLEALLRVKVPGVKEGDKVKINRATWIPWVHPSGDESRRWNFFNAGSGGKKTLLNACYALAVHRVAQKHHLPLPTFLMIDSPMKNISTDANRDIFLGFYDYLYEVAKGDLADTQFVIMDGEFIGPSEHQLDVLSRFMTPTDDEHPPLISYYRGP
jgi:hypothetical protein